MRGVENVFVTPIMFDEDEDSIPCSLEQSSDYGLFFTLEDGTLRWLGNSPSKEEVVVLGRRLAVVLEVDFLDREGDF